jgi:hypothetical protein
MVVRRRSRGAGREPGERLEKGAELVGGGDASLLEGLVVARAALRRG